MRGKWTPGPWEISPYSPRPDAPLVCASVEKSLICSVGNLGSTSDHAPTARRWKAETPANAYLIAAAPALYEALDELNKTIGGYMLTKGEDRLRYHAELKGPVAARVHAALSLAHPPKGDEL